MADTKFLLIGGGLAASRALHLIREQDEDASITLVGAEPHVPYDRPPLTKDYLQARVNRETLFYDTPDALEQLNVRLELENAVQSLDAETKRVRLAKGGRLSFDKALIATGGRPVRLDLPGAELDGVLYLRTLDDCEALKAQGREGAKAVIVGSGFIGMEAAASLTKRGVDVTVIEAAPRVWARFADQRLSAFFEDHCSKKGVTFRTGATVTGFRGTGHVEAVVLDGGESVFCDFALVAVGIRPRVELAHEAGLEVNDGIVVDAHLKTSHDDIYAAGDVANYPDPHFGKRRRVEHWGHAEYTGQVAGANMAGESMSYGLLTYVWSDMFDLHLEFGGDETEYERSLLRGNMDDASFTVLFVKRNRLTAYFSINGDDKEFATLQKLIKKRTDVRGIEGRITDPGTALGELV